MFEVGELVVYAGGDGVYRVDGVGLLDNPVAKQEQEYYTLTNILRNERNFIPVNTKAKLRLVITKTEVNLLMKRIPEIETRDLNHDNVKALSDYYETAIRSYDCETWVEVIKSIYIKKRRALDIGKKLTHTDEKYMKRAECLLFNELSVALGIPKEEVKGYIKDKAIDWENVEVVSKVG